MTLKFIVRFSCVGVLFLLRSFCHESPGVEPEGPIAASTLLQRARHQFEITIHKDSLCWYLKEIPQWEQAQTVTLPVGQALVVPVHERLSGLDGVMGKGKMVGYGSVYLLVYAGDDRQLRFEVVSAGVCGHPALNVRYWEI
jgi:hypothetical protein